MSTGTPEHWDTCALVSCEEWAQINQPSGGLTGMGFQSSEMSPHYVRHMVTVLSAVIW